MERNEIEILILRKFWEGVSDYPWNAPPPYNGLDCIKARVYDTRRRLEALDADPPRSEADFQRHGGTEPSVPRRGDAAQEAYLSRNQIALINLVSDPFFTRSTYDQAAAILKGMESLVPSLQLDNGTII